MKNLCILSRDPLETRGDWAVFGSPVVTPTMACIMMTTAYQPMFLGGCEEQVMSRVKQVKSFLADLSGR